MKNMVDRAAILRIAEQVRREQCPVNDEAPWSVGLCQFVSRILGERLAAAGLAARVIDGYYTAAVGLRGVTRSPMSAVTTSWDGVWLHWWIECEDLVIDAMADRFAPATESAPAIVIVPKTDALRYHARLPSGELPHVSSGTFEQ